MNNNFRVGALTSLFKNIFFTSILIYFCFNTSDLHAQQPEIMVVTGELPPYSFTQNGEISGVATDIVKELMHRVAYINGITSQPWKRAIVTSKRYRLTYPLARTPEREQNYKWIGPILEDHFAFAVQSSNTVDFNNINDFKKLTVGVNRGAPTELRLKRLNFERIEAVTKEKHNAKKLITDRIDAWYTTALMIKSQLKHLGINKTQVKIAFNDLKIEMYLVASLDIKDELVALWQKKLDEMKSDGSYQAILKKHDIHTG